MAIIETNRHCQDVRRRIEAIEALIASLKAVQADAIAGRAVLRLTDEDVADVSDTSGVGDAISNLNYTCNNLASDIAEWESFKISGGRQAMSGGAA